MYKSVLKGKTFNNACLIPLPLSGLVVKQYNARFANGRPWVRLPASPRRSLMIRALFALACFVSPKKQSRNIYKSGFSILLVVMSEFEEQIRNYNENADKFYNLLERFKNEPCKRTELSNFLLTSSLTYKLFLKNYSGTSTSEVIREDCNRKIGFLDGLLEEKGSFDNMIAYIEGNQEVLQPLAIE